MKEDLHIQNSITIPAHELDISASRAGGPGGQHVNKTSTRITVRWHLPTTQALTTLQKERVLEHLRNELTSDGDLIVHNGSTRSQVQNKKLALQQLAQKIRKALYVRKKRKKTGVPHGVKEDRLQKKKERSMVKKMRRKPISYD